MPVFYTYIIQSFSNDIIYIGQTNNISDRLLRHNNNRNKYTKNKGPWKIIFLKNFKTRSEAMKLEKHLKKFKNKEYLIKWIDNQK